MDGPTTRVVRGACHHDCPDTCVWDVTVDNGRAVKLRGNADHPFTRGELCPKVNRFLERVYHPDRIIRPMRRTGPKGSGRFETISWSDAIAEISERLEEVIGRAGGEAVLPYSFAGTQGLVQMGVMADRFFGAIEASDIRRDLCGVTASMGAAEVYGRPYGIDPEDMAQSRTIILWGTNTKLTNRHLWPTIETARSRGATVVVIDPIRTATAGAADHFIQIRPGTDVALVLAMINVLDSEGLVDVDFMAARATGWDELRASAQAMPPNLAESITGVPASGIEWLAKLYGTNRPAVIRTLIGPEHREHGLDIMRAVAMLPAVTGSWTEHGGGLARSTEVLHHTALGSGHGGARRRRTFNMADLGAVLAGFGGSGDRLDPPIEVLIVHNSNPAVICPDQNAVVDGLAREDLFCVVIEQFLTDTARYADVVLPATTQIEHLDLAIAWGHVHLALNKPAIEPVGECLPNSEIFRRLASAMHLDAPGLADTDEAMVRQLLDSDHEWLYGISYESLDRLAWQRLAIPPDWRPHTEVSEGGSGGRIRLGGLEYRPGLETPEGSPALAERFPLTLMSRKQHPKFLNAGYGGFDRHLPSVGRPTLAVHPDDAAARGIVEGREVTVFNDRGALTVIAELSDEVQPGLVTMPFGWWHRHTPDDRGVNALTNPRSVGGVGSAAFHETLVDVRPAP